ncbi:DNA repair protein RecO, partial [Streptomyces sp. NPDC051172]
MSLFRDDGIVLRTRKPGEADRIMLRCCGEHGARL